MRSSVLSALIVASTVSTALAAPTASSSFVAVEAPSSSVQAAAAASVSADPRIEKWAHMKVALPDGLFPEDKAVLEQQLQIVPMMVMNDASLPQPAAAAAAATVSRNRMDKHQRIDIQPAYKHMSIMDNTDEQDFYNVVEIAPLSPELQNDLNQEHEASISSKYTSRACVYHESIIEYILYTDTTQ